MEYEKQLVIIGNANAIAYKEIFPLVKDDKLWLGRGDRKFHVPDGYPLDAAGCGIDEDGKRLVRAKGSAFSFLDKHNPDQLEILGTASNGRCIGDFPCYTVINGRKAYNRILTRRRQANGN